MLKTIFKTFAPFRETHLECDRRRRKHPALGTQAVGGERVRVKFLTVVLTSDRGLAGGFNNNINRYAYKFWQENKDKYEVMDFMFIGRKGSDFFKARSILGKRQRF